MHPGSQWEDGAIGVVQGWILHRKLMVHPCGGSSVAGMGSALAPSLFL